MHVHVCVIEFASVEARKAKHARDKIDALTSTEGALRAQLANYADKFEQVQATLAKSNELFATFKAEMEKVCAYTTQSCTCV